MESTESAEQQSFVKKFPFNEEFQLALLQRMFTNETFMMKCCTYLTISHFKDKYLGWIFESISDYYRKHHKQPDFRVLHNKALLYRPEQQPEYMAIIDRLVNIKPFDPEYINDMLERFVINCEMINWYNQFGVTYKDRGPEQALLIAKTFQERINAVTFEEEGRVDFNKIEDYILEVQNSSRNAVPTGIIAIDEALKGGLARGGVTVILGATNAGKSMSLVNIAKFAMRAQKKTLYILHQDKEAQTSVRMLSCFTGIPFNRFLTFPAGFTQSELDLVKETKERMSKYLLLIPMRGAGVTVDDVRNRVTLIKKEFDYDLFIDDYAQLLKTNSHIAEDWRKQAEIYDIFSKIACELDVAVLTLVQGTREAQKLMERSTDHLRMSDFSGAFEIARLADTVISVNRTAVMEQNNEIMFYLLKQKYFGRKEFGVMCRTNMNCCSTHTDEFKPNEPPVQWEMGNPATIGGLGA
jgi:replicative DNA helicase